MNVKVVIVFFAAVTIGLIMLIMFSPAKNQIKLSDVLGSNPVAPNGVRFITKDIERNAKKL